MAAKLKNLKIRKVDFVDEGANPDADIKMRKKKDRERRGPEGEAENAGSMLKRLFAFIGKAAGMDQSEIDSAMDEIQKGSSMSFAERMNAVNNGKIADEMWDTCYALQSSLCSILNDEELDGTSAATAMQESLDEFYAVVQDSISKWSNGREAGVVRKNEEVSETDLEVMKAAVKRLNDTIGKVVKDTGSRKESKDDYEKSKGDNEEMKIDKSKMTEAEKAFLDSIEKRYGIQNDIGIHDGHMKSVSAIGIQTSDAASADPAVTKSITQSTGISSPAALTDEGDSIYKGLHPAVRAELEGLKKFRDEAEERDLAEIAKKYAIIGKRESELIPMFKSLKAAGGTAYNDMIAVLDQVVDTVEKSGVFSEIGKSGHGSTTDGSAWAEAEVKAVELMKSRTGLSKAQALDAVLAADPELAVRCEKED